LHGLEAIAAYLTEFRGSNSKRSIDEIEDESGLNLDTYKFVKKQRRMPEDSVKMKVFLQIAALRLEEGDCSDMMSYMITELQSESRNESPDYRGRAWLTFQSYFYSHDKLLSLFRERPFAGTLCEETMHFLAFHKRKGLLFLSQSAFNEFFNSMHDTIVE
jgi:hypothetical protein